ncbi:MAG: MG2 domain-containing protein [Phycisphaeraceae bacterium]
MIGRRMRTTLAVTLIAATLLIGLVFPGASPMAGGADRPAPPDRPEIDSYQTHLSTDKPIYREGETVYIRGVLLQADTQRPLDSQHQPQPHAMVRVTGPRGNVVHEALTRLEHSVLGSAWEVPDGQAGGEYTLTATVAGYAPAQRTFEVRSYRAPRLRTQIEFLREGYGPGDTVTATLDATRAEGGAPEGAQVTITARLDGEQVHESTTTINADGRATAHFPLPDAIARGDGTLAFTINDSGAVETATRTLPILLQTVDLGIYPEGGDLVAGIPNRVYIEARTPSQRPADIAGVVVDEEGETVAEFKTTHEGRGRFAFKPEAGQTYAMRIHQPAGIDRTFALPEVKAEGVVIQAMRETYDALDPIALTVLSAEDLEGLRVTLARRDRQVAASRVQFEHVSRRFGRVTLTPPDDVHGVLIATVWDGDGNPLAERLIYRQPRHQLDVSVTADASRYVPGESVELTVQTRDERGEPVSGVVGLTVTDDSVLELIQTREQAPRLPVMVLLEPEVRELADAQVYLDPDNADAPEQLDLLLGTQGWRRFATVDINAFVNEHDDDARRALALVGENGVGLSPGAGRRGNAGRDGQIMEALRMAAAPELREQGAADDDAQLFEQFDRSDAAAPPPGPDPANAEAAEAAEGQQGQQQAQAAMRQADAMQPLVRAEMEMLNQAEPEPLRDRRRMARTLIVREYAHRARPDRDPTDRRDFTETLYWHAGVQTDDTGQATVRFDLSDAVTTFRVFADGFDSRGALGTASETVESVQPFYVEAALPQEVTAGDRIDLPIALVNNTDQTLDRAWFSSEADSEAIESSQRAPSSEFIMQPEQRKRLVLPLHVGQASDAVDVTVRASAAGHLDQVTRPVRVVPRGFPVERGGGGIVSPDAPLTYTVRIPDTVVPGSIETRVSVYPSPVGNLTDAVAGLIRQPSGCFEQTSSTTYPMVMAIEYLQSDPQASAATLKEAHAMLDDGYQRLIGFETDTGGFEWFGKSPGHLGLTAYGLLQFTDMARIREVDPDMLARTRQWLLDQRDGKGSFTNEARTLHTWSPDPAVTDAYVVWALLRAGEDPATLATEIDAAKAHAVDTDNSYVKALGALIARNTGDDATARQLNDALARQRDDAGFVDGGTTTVTSSGGQALSIETTALAGLAWLGEGDRIEPVEAAVRAIAGTAQGGRYGSTQSTVLALHTIIEYNTARAADQTDGQVQLRVNGEPIANPARFTSDAAGVIDLADFADQLGPGEHTIEVAMADGSPIPAAVTVRYHDELPDTSADCALTLDVALSDTELDEGAVTEARVTVTNTTDDAVAMPIAIVGIPGGMEVRHDQLAELVDAERIAAYEVAPGGRNVVLYWRGFEAGEQVSLPLDLVAAIPGQYTAPASRAYLYYTDEHRTWAPGVAATIAPRK